MHFIFQDIKKNLEASYLDIVKTNWKIWPATQLVNFYFVPFKHRILVNINYFLSSYKLFKIARR